jgi:hypothetical protein
MVVIKGGVARENDGNYVSENPSVVLAPGMFSLSGLFTGGFLKRPL